MSIWSARRARALALLSEAPHAAEILACYAALTEVQERVAERLPIPRWVAVVKERASAGPAARLERLPLDEMIPLFGDFLHEAQVVGTAVMRAEAARIRDADVDERRALLAGALAVRGPMQAEVPFHARAFVEAIAAPLASALALPPEEAEAGDARRCRACGDHPVAATLRDLPGALGTRALVCGRCGTETRIRRLTCAHCGERAAERLGVHTAESVPHVRVDECRSCRRYIKTVDLRRRGDAVAVVDELATVELDLWAHEQGLTKVHPNLFGL